MGRKVEDGELSHRLSSGKCLCPPAWTSGLPSRPRSAQGQGSKTSPGERAGGWDEGRLASVLDRRALLMGPGPQGQRAEEEGWCQGQGHRWWEGKPLMAP